MTATGSRVGPKGATVGKKAHAQDLSHYSGRTGAQIRRLRTHAKVTVAELAKAIGVSHKTVYSWEAGDTAIPLDAIPLIAKKLRVTIADLLPKA